MNPAYLLLRRFILALCVWREARGESFVGKMLVAQVIENRVTDRRWPDNYEDAILQPWQFSSFNPSDPNVQKFPREDDQTWPDCVGAADEVLSNSEPISSANHYHVIGLHPAWANPDKVVATEGHHVFYHL